MQAAPPLRGSWRSHSARLSFLDAVLPRPWPAAHPAYQRWTLVLTALGLYSAFTTCFRLAFVGATLHPEEGPQGSSGQFNSFGLFIDMVFVADSLVTALLVLPDDVAEARPEQIAWHCFRSGRMLMDLLYAWPWDYISATGGAPQRLVFSLGLLRLLRLRLTFRALAEAEAEARMPYAYLRFFRFAFMLSLEAHFFACAFFYLSQQEGSGAATWMVVCGGAKPGGVPDTIWRQYLLSLYWSLTTLSSIGYGDMTPQTDPEFIMVACYMMINYCISVYIIGNMTILTTQADAATRAFRKQLADAEAFMTTYRLAPSMQRHMRGVLTLRFNDAREHREVLDAMPPALRRRVAASLYRPLIARAYIFEGLPPGDPFVAVFATSLVVELYMPGMNILTQGAPALELFFVASGTADALLADGAADGCAGGEEPASGDTVLGVEDVYRLLEIMAVDSHNQQPRD